MHDPTPYFGISDPFSTTTHLLGALVFAILGARLIYRAAQRQLAPKAVAIYVATVVLALVASGVFHWSARATETRALLMMMDHAAIFLLIAGSYTPIHVIQFTGLMRWGVLTLVWVAALGGAMAKLWFFETIPEWVGLSLYLTLGWAGLFTATALYLRHGPRPLTLLVLGALAYTIGAGLEFARIPTIATGIIGPHEVFHAFVLAGIACHWRYIARLVE